jgi:hypothetical protein
MVCKLEEKDISSSLVKRIHLKDIVQLAVN